MNEDQKRHDEEAAWADIVTRLSADPQFSADVPEAGDEPDSTVPRLAQPFRGLDDEAVLFDDTADSSESTTPDASLAPDRPGFGFAGFDPLGVGPGREKDAPASQGGPRDYSVDDDVVEELDRFVPEEPEPLSFSDPRLVLAWVGAAGGPLLAVVLMIFFRNAPQPVWWLLGLGFLGGLAYLFSRMPKDRDESGYDDGARF